MQERRAGIGEHPQRGSQVIEAGLALMPFFGIVSLIADLSLAIFVRSTLALLIRNDNALNPLIFSIGLGGTSVKPIDHELLRRIANDLQSPIYDSTKQAGLYVYSPALSQLTDAFNKVASEILRLAM